VKVTREEFEHLCLELVERCVDICRSVISSKKLSFNDVDEVLLVGGATRMPMIKNALFQLTGAPFSAFLKPGECVVLGAALAGALRHRPNHPAFNAHPESETPPSTLLLPAGLAPIEIRELTTHSLGVVVLDRQHRERVLTLIEAATPLPCEQRKRFGYAYDNTTAIRVEVTEGRGRLRDEVQVIGELILDNLPPRKQGTPVEVVFRYDINQLLDVCAIDVETGSRRHATFYPRGGGRKPPPSVA